MYLSKDGKFWFIKRHGVEIARAITLDYVFTLAILEIEKEKHLSIL